MKFQWTFASYRYSSASSSLSSLVILVAVVNCTIDSGSSCFGVKLFRNSEQEEG